MPQGVFCTTTTGFISKQGCRCRAYMLSMAASEVFGDIYFFGVGCGCVVVVGLEERKKYDTFTFMFTPSVALKVRNAANAGPPVLSAPQSKRKTNNTSCCFFSDLFFSFLWTQSRCRVLNNTLLLMYTHTLAFTHPSIHSLIPRVRFTCPPSFLLSSLRCAA